MAKSMTGYGKAIVENENKIVHIEIKSLNSKYSDVSLKLPKELGARELDIRNLMQNLLQRGKIAGYLECTHKRRETQAHIDQKLFREYFNQLKATAESVGLEDENVFKTALSMPEVITTGSEISEVSDEDWIMVQSGIQKACAQLSEFRQKEGENLEKALITYIEDIRSNLEHIKKADPERKTQIKTRIQSQMEQLKEVNQERLEQELIYYYEKLDITEELVRLESHLDYFLSELPKAACGKKLGFIAQEIGREINTIGSKANNADIQKFVVLMKDDLEKIKEQSLNIL